MIVAEDDAKSSIKSIVPESSGDGVWFNDDDDYFVLKPFAESYEPYNNAAHLKPGVEYSVVVDACMTKFRADQFRQAQWDPCLA